MLYCLYQITNTLNNKIYIGVHQTNNLNDPYIGSGKLLKAAIKKYGKDNFKKTILEIFDTESEMIAREIEIVTEEFCSRDNTYNIMPGGKFGSYKRNGLSFKGKQHTEETKEKISIAATGRLHTKETKEKIATNNYARRDPEAHLAHVTKINSVPKTQDHRQKIKESALKVKSGKKNKGKEKPKVQCPHCSKVGAIHVMKRWHFEKCKKLIGE